DFHVTGVQTCALPILIIAALAYYAWHLTAKVKNLQQTQQDEAAQAELHLRNRQLELLQDIRFIARAVLAEQCEITEGVLRIQYRSEERRVGEERSCRW